MQTAGVFVSALPKLPARVEIREHEFHGGHLPFRVHVHRNAASVIPDRNRAVHVNRHLDFVAMTRQMLVNRIVEHLEHAVMQAALVRIADIHARTFANGFQTFELVNF